MSGGGWQPGCGLVLQGTLEFAVPPPLPPMLPPGEDYPTEGAREYSRELGAFLC